MGRFRICPDCREEFYQKQTYTTCPRCYRRRHAHEYVDHYVRYTLSSIAWWKRVVKDDWILCRLEEKAENRKAPY